MRDNMSTKRKASPGRPVTTGRSRKAPAVLVRLSVEEAKQLDRWRGVVSRAEWLRRHGLNEASKR